MLILVNRAEEKLSVQREIAKFWTVYRVCYTPIETLITRVEQNLFRIDAREFVVEVALMLTSNLICI